MASMSDVRLHRVEYPYSGPLLHQGATPMLEARVINPWELMAPRVTIQCSCGYLMSDDSAFCSKCGAQRLGPVPTPGGTLQFSSATLATRGLDPNRITGSTNGSIPTTRTPPRPDAHGSDINSLTAEQTEFLVDHRIGKAIEMINILSNASEERFAHLEVDCQAKDILLQQLQVGLDERFAKIEADREEQHLTLQELRLSLDQCQTQLTNSALQGTVHGAGSSTSKGHEQGEVMNHLSGLHGDLEAMRNQVLIAISSQKQDHSRLEAKVEDLNKAFHESLAATPLHQEQMHLKAMSVDGSLEILRRDVMTLQAQLKTFEPIMKEVQRDFNGLEAMVQQQLEALKSEYDEQEGGLRQVTALQDQLHTLTNRLSSIEQEVQYGQQECFKVIEAQKVSISESVNEEAVTRAANVADLHARFTQEIADVTCRIELQKDEASTDSQVSAVVEQNRMVILRVEAALQEESANRVRECGEVRKHLGRAVDKEREDRQRHNADIQMDLMKAISRERDERIRELSDQRKELARTVRELKTEQAQVSEGI